MTKIASLQAVDAALLACGLAAAPAQAGPNRTFVSGTGTDSGACTRAAPCKTFAFALTQTAAGGEIAVLDPAGYGPVTIMHAISIVNDGVGTAGITAGSGNAITINAGASDRVHLRGLTIEGIGSGSNGILFNSGGNLAIENCVIQGFTNGGINISPSTSSIFSVSNTIDSNNPGGTGIQPTGSAAGVTGVLSRVITNNNGDDGIFMDGAAIIVLADELRVTIVGSEASKNFNAGVQVASSAAIFTFATLRDVVASNNGTGLATEGNGVIWVAHSVVTGNGTGVAKLVFGGRILSYGDNDIDGNITDNTGILSVIPTH